MPGRRDIISAAIAATLAAPLLLRASGAASQDRAAGRPAGGGGVLGLLPPDATTSHTLTLPEGALSFTATAGTLNLFGQDGQRLAAVFYTAYTQRQAADGAAAARPVTFCFNGGPGAASAYLHLGLVGPRVLDFGPDHDPAKAQLCDNPDTWLRFTDLVLVDPVGTGWSRAAKPSDAHDFWGVRQDAEALAKIVALWLERNGRGLSPLFLLGESYGGLRTAKLAREALRQQGLAVSGIAMLSPLLQSDLALGAARDTALGAALQLPSLAAAALARRGALTPEALQAAERFALGEYLTTLAGPRPSGEAADRFYARVADLTGLPADIVARTEGFIGDTYKKMLYARRRDLASNYDIDLTAPDPWPGSLDAEGADPVLDGFTRAFGSAFVAYAGNVLRFRTEMTYQLLATDVNRHWDWHSGGSPLSGPSAVGDLRELFALLPSFRLLVGHGMFDLETPFAASRYVLDHLPEADAGRSMLKLYRGGHMLYLTPDSRAAFTADARTLYGTA